MQIRIDQIFFGVISGLLAVCCTPAEADIMVFTNQAAFDAARGPGTLATEDFSSATAGLLAKGVAHGFGGFSATAVDPAGSNMAFYVAPNPFSDAERVPFTTSQYLGWSEDHPSFSGTGDFGPTVTIDFDQPQTAVSFDFLDTDFTDEYRLLVDGTEVSFPSSAPSFEGTPFIGIVSNTGTFSQLTAQSTSPGGTVDSFGIDNLSFNATHANVPEPTSVATWSLLGLMGFVYCGWQRKRRCRVSA